MRAVVDGELPPPAAPGTLPGGPPRGARKDVRPGDPIGTLKSISVDVYEVRKRDGDGRPLTSVGLPRDHYIDGVLYRGGSLVEFGPDGRVERATNVKP